MIKIIEKKAAVVRGCIELNSLELHKVYGGECMCWCIDNNNKKNFEVWTAFNEKACENYCEVRGFSKGECREIRFNSRTKRGYSYVTGGVGVSEY